MKCAIYQHVGMPNDRPPPNPDVAARMQEALKRYTAKTGKNASALSAAIGQSKQTLSSALRTGRGSMTLFAAFCEETGESLDYIVLGRYPAADPIFVQALTEYLAGKKESLEKFVANKRSKGL